MKSQAMRFWRGPSERSLFSTAERIIVPRAVDIACHPRIPPMNFIVYIKTHRRPSHRNFLGRGNHVRAPRVAHARASCSLYPSPRISLTVGGFVGGLPDPVGGFPVLSIPGYLQNGESPWTSACYRLLTISQANQGFGEGVDHIPRGWPFDMFLGSSVFVLSAFSSSSPFLAGLKHAVILSEPKR